MIRRLTVLLTFGALFPTSCARQEPPLTRNEWICRVQSVKKPETRRKHVEQARSNLGDGKRRPCCWPGRPHREKTGRAEE